MTASTSTSTSPSTSASPSTQTTQQGAPPADTGGTVAPGAPIQVDQGTGGAGGTTGTTQGTTTGGTTSAPGVTSTVPAPAQTTSTSTTPTTAPTTPTTTDTTTKPGETTKVPGEPPPGQPEQDDRTEGFNVSDILGYGMVGQVESVPRDLSFSFAAESTGIFLPVLAPQTLALQAPNVTVQITNLTPKALGGDTSVNEDDLLAIRGLGESEGSDPIKESTTGHISAPDGVGSLTVGGQTVITNDVFAPISFTTPLGNTLSILSYNAVTGLITYEYTLLDNEIHPVDAGENNLFENFTVVLSDTDDDTETDTLTIRIVDDIPTFRNVNDPDFDTVVEISALNPAADIIHSVQLADWIYGADGPGPLPILTASTGNLIFNSVSANQVTLQFLDASSVVVAVITLNSNGNDSLQLSARPSLSPDLNYTFTLQIQDTDGDPVTQKFSLHLDGDPVVTAPGFTVDGPIADATVFQDVNNNALLDEGEACAISDEYGAFNLMIIDTNGDGVLDTQDGRLVSLGGKDTATGLSYKIPLFAPIGSNVISPLTSVLQMQLASGKSSATTELASRLGFSPATVLTQLNPLVLARENNLTALLQTAAIMTLAVQLSEAFGQVLGVPEASVADKIYLGIGNQLLQLPTDTVADFSNAELLHRIVEDISLQLDLDTAKFDPIMNLMISSQDAIAHSLDNLSEGADPVEVISAVQYMTQGEVANTVPSFYLEEFTESTALSEVALILEQEEVEENPVLQVEGEEDSLLIIPEELENTAPVLDNIFPEGFCDSIPIFLELNQEDNPFEVPFEAKVDESTLILSNTETIEPINMTDVFELNQPVPLAEDKASIDLEQLLESIGQNNDSAIALKITLTIEYSECSCPPPTATCVVIEQHLQNTVNEANVA